MRLRTRLNLLVAALSAAFVIVLIAAEIEATRDSVREEMEAANRVASQLLGRLTTSVLQDRRPGPGAAVSRSNSAGCAPTRCTSQSAARRRALPLAAGDLQGRPRGAGLVRAALSRRDRRARPFQLRGGVRLVVAGTTLARRARCLGRRSCVSSTVAAPSCSIVVNGLAFWSVDRLFEPIPGHRRRPGAAASSGDLAFRLPPLPGSEANAIGGGLQPHGGRRVEDKVQCRASRRTRRKRASRSAGKWLRWRTSASRRNAD